MRSTMPESMLDQQDESVTTVCEAVGVFDDDA
jgi:hypothetical protein